MEGNKSDNSDVLFALWSKKVEPILNSKYVPKNLNSDDEILTYWQILGRHDKKSKHGEIIEALNYMRFKRLRELTTCLSSSIDAKCK